MSEQTDKLRFRDPEAQQRFNFIVSTGKDILSSTALLDPSKKITQEDLDKIDAFHREISPANPKRPWRLERGKSPDPSFFRNWEMPGGPLEHMRLAGLSARIIASTIKEHSKGQIDIDPFLVSAAAALHDEGREITHVLYTNELIGTALLKKIGIRQDIIDLLPDETILWTKENIDDLISKLSPETIIVRLSDELGKRKEGTNRLYRRDDFLPGFHEMWFQQYLSRSPTGRPSDDLMRKKMGFHIQNGQKYWEAINKWLQSVTDLTIDDLTRILNKELSPDLTPFSEKVLLSSNDMIDGEVTQRKLELDGHKIEVKAVTHIGGPNKKFNEDGCSVITNGSSLQIFVVDGGTQVGQIPSLNEISGGQYVKKTVIDSSKSLDPSKSVEQNMYVLNTKLREDIEKNHPDIKYGKSAKNVPYGSIAGIFINAESDILEIANAGDVSVVVLDKTKGPVILTQDDIHPFDQLVFQKVRQVAKSKGKSVREIMAGYVKDLSSSEILEQGLVTVRGRNTGEIPVITGSDVFRVHTNRYSLSATNEIFIFTDGAIPIGVDIYTPQGLKEFVDFVKSGELTDLLEERKKRVAADPDFEKSPRFRDLDDMMLVQVNLV